MRNVRDFLQQRLLGRGGRGTSPTLRRRFGTRSRSHTIRSARDDRAAPSSSDGPFPTPIKLFKMPPTLGSMRGRPPFREMGLRYALDVRNRDGPNLRQPPVDPFRSPSTVAASPSRLALLTTVSAPVTTCRSIWFLTLLNSRSVTGSSITRCKCFFDLSQNLGLVRPGHHDRPAPARPSSSNDTTPAIAAWQIFDS